MSDKNIWEAVFQSFGKVSNCIQTHLHNVLNQTNLTPPTTQNKPLFSIYSTSSSSKVHQIPDTDPTNHVPVKSILDKGNTGGPVTKEELGRATWTFLHTLAAQYPEKPTRQQKRDVKELMSILSRLYPCKECADHFKEILRGNPVEAGSQFEFSRWLCHVHNIVNRSLGKPVFPCERVDARWGKLDCEQRACDLLGDAPNFGRD